MSESQLERFVDFIQNHGPNDDIIRKPRTIELSVGKSNKVAIILTPEGVSISKDADDADLSIPLSGDQIESLLASETEFAIEYMRGDIKPVGSSGALLDLVALLNDGLAKASGS